MTYKPGPAVISQCSTVKWDRHIKSKVSVTVEISIINNDNSINHFLSRKCLFLWGSIGARSLITCTKLTRKRSATNRFVSRANMNAIFIYMYATQYTQYTPFIILHSIHHFRSSKERSTKCSCSLIKRRIDTKLK